MTRHRSHSRGVTPVAAALALAVVGAGASCVWLFDRVGAGHDAQASSRADAAQIQAAAKSYRAEHTDGCPTLSLLEEERFLSHNARADDAWGDRFRVRCDGDEPVVSSAGPDGKLGTRDDVRFPR